MLFNPFEFVFCAGRTDRLLPDRAFRLARRGGRHPLPRLPVLLRLVEQGPWANQNGSGADAHRAQHHGPLLTGARKHPDRHFKYTLKRLRNAKGDGKIAASGSSPGRL